MAASLPNNPSLDRFRRDARRLQRAVRAGVPDAVSLVERHHPDGMRVDRSAFTLTDAQLVVARGYGFASWPKLKHYLELAAELRRDPSTPGLATMSRASAPSPASSTPRRTSPPAGPKPRISLRTTGSACAEHLCRLGRGRPGGGSGAPRRRPVGRHA